MKKTLKEKFEAKIHKTDNCWLWTGSLIMGGYGSFGYDKKYEYTHRLSYILFKGEIPRGLCVLHTCDNRGCVRPDHLFLGTLGDNVADMFNKERNIRGEKHWSAKLNETQVIEIRNKYMNKITQKQLAQEYDIHRTTIADIVSRRKWKHIK